MVFLDLHHAHTMTIMMMISKPGNAPMVIIVTFRFPLSEINKTRTIVCISGMVLHSNKIKSSHHLHSHSPCQRTEIFTNLHGNSS